jgi:hypothetical protein
MANSIKPFADINAIRLTQEAVCKQPELGTITFKVSGQSSGGLALLSQIGSLAQSGEVDNSRNGQYRMIYDEPVAL